MLRVLFGRAFLVGTAVALSAAAAPGPLARIRVQAGAHDRLDTPIRVALPGLDPAVTSALLTEDGSGRHLPAQVDRPGGEARLAFILAGSTPAGSERVFALTANHSEPRLSTRDDGAAIEVRLDDRSVLCYRHAVVAPPQGQPARLARSGYLHPVWTPAGAVVTGDFAADHPHQRGVFLAWTRTTYQGRNPDFWNLGSGSGRVRCVGVGQVVSGPVWGGVRALQVHEDLGVAAGPVAVLHETWEVTVWCLGGPGAGWWLWDLEVQQSTAGADPLRLPKYHYGGMAFRGCDAWVRSPWEFLSSAGRTRADADASVAVWGDLSGPIGGGWAGLTMIGHPANLRHPQPLRCHTSMPYFCMTPSQQGPWSIAPGVPLRLRYRFIVHDGKANAALAERLSRDFAEPPLVLAEETR